MCRALMIYLEKKKLFVRDNKYFNFDKLNSSISITAQGKGVIRIFISNHEKIATVKIDSEEFKTYTVQTIKKWVLFNRYFYCLKGREFR